MSVSERMPLFRALAKNMAMNATQNMRSKNYLSYGFHTEVRPLYVLPLCPGSVCAAFARANQRLDAGYTQSLGFM